jgi:hypothetical protein
MTLRTICEDSEAEPDVHDQSRKLSSSKRSSTSNDDNAIQSRSGISKLLACLPVPKLGLGSQVSVARWLAYRCNAMMCTYYKSYALHLHRACTPDVAEPWPI